MTKQEADYETLNELHGEVVKVRNKEGRVIKEVTRTAEIVDITEDKGKKTFYYKILVIEGDTVTKLGQRLGRSFKKSIKYYKMKINDPAKEGGGEGSLKSNTHSDHEDKIFPGSYFYIPCHMTHPVKKQKIKKKIEGEFANFAMDCHMHIQSGNCAPMPLLWKAADSWVADKTTPRRSYSNAVAKPFKGYLIDLGKMETLTLGHLVVSLNEDHYINHFADKNKGEKTNNNLTPMMLMPMDMDLAHLEGYWGEPIYYGVHRKLTAYKYDKDGYKIEKDIFPVRKYNFQAGKYYTEEEINEAEMNQILKYKHKGYSFEEIFYGSERKKRAEEIKEDNEEIDKKNKEIDKKNKEIDELNKKLGDANFKIKESNKKNNKKESLFKRKSRIEREEKEINEFSEDGFFYYYYEYNGDNKDGYPTWKPKWLKDEECGLFENYKKQMLENEKAAIIHPFKIIPLFHYDPRRWQEPNKLRLEVTGPKEEKSKESEFLDTTLTDDWDKPLKWVATEKSSGHYAGIKMYTSLGYKPTDFKILPHLKDFFKKCEGDSIPIMCHCTPEGMPNNERPLYIKLDKPEATKKTYEGFFSNEVNYYNENYVSPMAWEKCLKEFKKLRICLAHFMGREWDEWVKWVNKKTKNQKNYYHEVHRIAMTKKQIEKTRDDNLKEWFVSLENGRWIKKCLQLLEKYENVYTDLSFFILKENINAFKWLLHNYNGWEKLDKNDVPIIKEPKFSEECTYFNEKIRKKIMFGTDWYVLEPKCAGYGNFVKDIKRLLDTIDPGDPKQNKPSLWEDFSTTNPLKFYRLDKILDKYKDGLLKWNEHLQEEKVEYIDPNDWRVKAKWEAGDFIKNIESNCKKMKKYFVHLNNKKKTKEKNET
ncbi:MAG: hypothetical protein GY714_25930 [Desulfobacterales bacterium]|nr:hypothetical protein [Desulfobacterales bacterium]